MSESDSDEGEVVNYMNESDSSDSDNDDNLMISQQLLPGFSVEREKEKEGVNNKNKNLINSTLTKYD